MIEAYKILTSVLQKTGTLAEKDIEKSFPLWREKKIEKGNFFNMQNVVCNDLGIVTKGLFRIYYNDPDTKEEKNIYFSSESQFIVSFRSFITRYPCNYFIQAMEDSEIIYISYDDLQNLYSKQIEWSNFGRMLAEHFFNYSQARTEDLLFLNHEQRFLKLLSEHANIINRVPAYHVSSYLGIKNPSLSRIRKRINK